MVQDPKTPWNKKNPYNRPFAYYDIECRTHDFLIVFKIDGEFINIHNWKVVDNQMNLIDENGFDKMVDIIHNYTLIGYNNHHYDDKMITKAYQSSLLMSNDLLKAYSDAIIVHRQHWHTDWEIISLDSMKYIPTDNESGKSKSKVMVGLKEIQSKLGENIHEAGTPFDYPHPMSKEQLIEDIL